jgi:hypothetical protein
MMKDTLPGGWEILEVRPADTALLRFDDGRDAISITRSMRVTTWDSGVVRMPELPFVLAEDTLRSNALLFAVDAPSLGSEGQIANFHDVIDVDWTLAEQLRRALPALLALFAFGAAAWFAFTWWKRRKATATAEAPEPKKPLEPADVIALRALRTLQERALWKQGNPKAHHSGISDALRAYLEHRFGITAREQTTTEIARNLRALAISGELAAEFISVLELADLVKFAKYQGEAADHERSIRRAIELVERTRPVAVESPVKP